MLDLAYSENQVKDLTLYNDKISTSLRTGSRGVVRMKESGVQLVKTGYEEMNNAKRIKISFSIYKSVLWLIVRSKTLRHE